jgi:beta-glucosidase
MATVKHFACNNSDFRRKSMNAVVEERALNEIYTPAFQAAIDAGAWAIMTSYNQVNGEWMGQNQTMVAGFLRQQLGFQWLVMTDWVSTWDGDKILSSGIDLDMPTGRALRPMRDKLLGNPAIDRMARNILRTFIASGVYGEEAAKKFRDLSLLEKFPEHVGIARKVNEGGIVLLKNNGLLPLSLDGAGPVVVCGNQARRRELAGGGSGHVSGYDLATYAEEAARRFGEARVVVDPAPTDELLRSAAAVLVFSGFDQEGEGSNRPFTLPTRKPWFSSRPEVGWRPTGRTAWRASCLLPMADRPVPPPHLTFCWAA